MAENGIIMKVLLQNYSTTMKNFRFLIRNSRLKSRSGNQVRKNFSFTPIQLSESKVIHLPFKSRKIREDIISEY